MLRLVHPAPQGKETRVPKGQRSQALSLTRDESARLRAALKNLRRAYGGWDVLAAVTGIRANTLENIAYGTKGGSAAVALRVARAAAMPVEQLLSGGVVEARACPLCHRKGAS